MPESILILMDYIFSLFHLHLEKYPWLWRLILMFFRPFHLFVFLVSWCNFHRTSVLESCKFPVSCALPPPPPRFIFASIGSLQADLYAGALFIQLALNKTSSEWLYLSILFLLAIAAISYLILNMDFALNYLRRLLSLSSQTKYTIIWTLRKFLF